MKTPSTPKLAYDLWQGLATAWRAMRDPKVALWKKAIPVLCLAYLIWPLDLLADPVLGLGQIDDLALIIAGLRLFTHLAQLDGAQAAAEQDGAPMGETIDASYRVVD